MASDNDPRSLFAVDGLQVGFQPVDLGIHLAVDGTGTLASCAANLIRTNKAVTKVGFGVELDEMSHAAVPAVPEVTGAARNIAGHAEVILKASEVGLSGHADAEVVCDVVGLVSGAAIVTVRFVVSGSNHVGARCGDRHHFVVKVVQDGLIHLVSLLDGGVGQESLDLLL